MPTVFISGASRGLGLEFARQYAADGWRVLASCRQPPEAAELAALAADSDGAVSVYRLDVGDFDDVPVLARRLRSQLPDGLDVLLCNAGVYGDRGADGAMELGGLDYGAWAYTFHVNAMAPIRLAECFLDQVARSEQKKIVAVTSKMGSIADNTSGGAYLYRTSKAALNMGFKSLALDVADRGVSCCVMHPGWVATDMGGAAAPMTPVDSVRGMRQVIADLAPATSGRFFLHDGSVLPW